MEFCFCFFVCLSIFCYLIVSGQSILKLDLGDPNVRADIAYSLTHYGDERPET